MNQKIFVTTKHIIRRIMHFFHNNFVLVCNILCGNKYFKILWICVPRTLFPGGGEHIRFHLYPWHWGLGLCCSPLKEVRFQQMTPSIDYFPAYTLCCDTLVVLMVRRLISLGGYFPSPLDPPPPPPLYELFFGKEDW